MEYIVENKGPYDKIHLVSYSFGSVVALDTLFPQDGISVRRLEKIDSLVTIGCPFNMVESYWEGYFKRRPKPPQIPATWLNVSSPFAALGSDFKDTGGGKMACCSEGDGSLPEGIRPNEHRSYYVGKRDKASSLGFLALRGLSAHGLYMGPRPEDNKDCFSVIMPELLGEDHPMMR